MTAITRYRLNVDRDGLSLAERIHVQRTARDWTQHMLAQRARLGLNTIQKVEQEIVKAVRADTIGRCADVFGVSMDWLWFGRRGLQP